jgi:hypothetical protein
MVSTAVNPVLGKIAEYTSVKADYQALVDGNTDDSSAVANAAAGGVFLVPPGTLKTNTAPSSFGLYSFGASFSGSAPLDGPYPAFGSGVFRAIQKGTTNCIIGIVHNNSAASTLAEPCAITGYGRVDNGGNVVFGIFGRADIYGTSGVATNEVDSFNFGGAPSSTLPPDRSIGTAQLHPIAWTVAAGGSHNSSIGIHICREGGTPQQFLTGMYLSADAIVNYGIVVDAVSTSTQIPALLKHGVGAIAVQVQGVGTPVGSNAWLTYVDGGGVTQFSVKQNGQLSFASGVSQTTVGAAGTASSLPTVPTGYLKVMVNGLAKAVPYYEAA